MISFHNSGLVLMVVVYSSCLVVNSEFETVSPSQKDTPLCRTVRNIRKNLLQEFQSHFKNDELACDIQDNCKSTNCTFKYDTHSQKSITGGYKLSICEKTSFVQFWIRDKVYNFTVSPEAQRIPVLHNDDDGHQSSQKWYLRVMLRKNRIRSREQISSDVYLTLTAAFEVWNSSSKSTKPILAITIMNDVRFYLNQLCSSPKEPQTLKLGELRLAVQSSPKLKMLAQDNDSWKPDDLHINVKRTSPISSRIGKPCKGDEVSECGNEATCHLFEKSSGICECIPNYEEKNGECVLTVPVNPTVQPFPSTNNATTASALAALLAVIVLISLAAAIFFGTKYRVLSRVRNCISLHMPFRSTSIDDQVGMVDPFANDEDDPPLL